MAFTQFRKSDFITRSLPQKKTGQKIVITVDGPAASGKGTLAAKMAERLGYAYLDTGALYRAVGLAVLETGGDPTQFDEVLPALNIIKANLTQELLASPALRTPEVSDAASKVAALPEVRLELLGFQRDFANNPPDNMGGAVLDGRDTGTVVCPSADIKFFVTADAAVRAKRRLADIQKYKRNASFEQVLADLKERDARDSLRKFAPTIPADDAYVVDTTTLGPSEVLEEAIAVIRAKFLQETDV